MQTDPEIVAIALLTRENVRWFGASVKKIYRLDDGPRFDKLLKALDDAESADTGEIR